MYEKAPKDPISARLLYLSPPKNSPTQEASATPKSGHRTAGDIPLAKKDTLLSWILYWYVRLRSRWAVGCSGLLHRIFSYVTKRRMKEERPPKYLLQCEPCLLPR